MFQLLRSLLGKRPGKSSSGKNFHKDFAYRFSAADAVYIEQALNVLSKMGLHPRFPPEKLREKSEQIASEIEGVFCSQQPTAGHWVLFAVSGEDRTFTNAMCLDDHCYDGLTAPGLADMIRNIVGMASTEWQVADVEIIEDGHAFELGSYVGVQIIASPPVTSFQLQLGKDFDWTLIYRLNERLPISVTKKFAILLDGSATIVFLEPDQVDKLNEYCGYVFFYEE